MNQLAVKSPCLLDQADVASQSTVVSIDMANVVSWSFNDENKQFVVDEVALVDLLVKCRTIGKVDVYKPLPNLDLSDYSYLQAWLLDNEPMDYYSIMAMRLSEKESRKALLRTVIEVASASLHYRRIKNRAIYVLKKMNELEDLKVMQQSGANVVTKPSKVINKVLIDDHDYRTVLQDVSRRVAKLLEDVSRDNFMAKPKLSRIRLEDIGIQLLSVANVTAQLKDHEEFGPAFGVIEQGMIELSDQVGVVKSDFVMMSDMQNIMRETLTWIQYVLTTKEMSKNKCNMDTEIVVGSLSPKTLGQFDNFMFWSGDGDFSSLYEKLNEMGKKVVVVSQRNSLGREVWELERNGIVSWIDPHLMGKIWIPKSDF